MSSFLRRCVECPKCLTRYLIAFSPYCNGSYLVPTVVASPEEYILYCSCGRPPGLTRLPRDVETTQTILRKPVDSGHTHQTVQDVLDGLAVLERSREDGETRFNINSLKHLKSFFSGAFRLALQQEYDEGRNPVRETSLPKARGPEDTYAYSLEEILAMIEVVPEPASSVIATAAFAGARRGEIRGMFCENYRDCAMQIARCVWNGHVTDPKSAKSKGAIPIISRLASKLNAYRARQGNPISGPMFPNDAEKPMDLNNLLNRVDPASPGRLRTMPNKHERSQQGRLRFQA